MHALRALPILLAFMTVFVSGIVAAAPPSDAACREAFLRANRELTTSSSYHITFDFTASLAAQGESISFAGDGECDFQQKPLLLKNNMNFVVDTTGKREQVAFLQYIEAAGDQLSTYSKINDRWVRALMPNPYGNYSEYLASHDNLLKAMRISFVRETDDTLVLEAALSGDMVRQWIEKELAAQGGPQLKLPESLFQDLEDLKYTVAIDKKTLRIDRVALDLGDFCRAIGQKLVDELQLPEMQKALLREALRSVKVQMNITFSRFNDIGTITIPREARSAPLVTPPPAVGPPAKLPAKPPVIDKTPDKTPPPASTGDTIVSCATSG
jgi:hypothetical protein